MPATAAAVPQLRHAVTDFASQQGVPDPPLASVRLAVSEAVANAVTHGYREESSPGDVELDAEVQGSELHITVRDRGIGFAPRFDSPGAGFGLPIIAAVADGYEVRKVDPSGTELHFCFKL